jgi:hypothetical protein
MKELIPLLAQGTETEFLVPQAGIYTVRVDNIAQKIIVR